jgi:hypothetical protein
MAMTFTTLIAAKTTAGSIKRWVNYSEIDSEQILDEAQALIVQTLRVREMREEFSDLSLAAGDYYKTLPSGFLDPIALRDKTNNMTLKLKTEAYLIGQREYESGMLISDTPQMYAIFGEKLQFECKYTDAATLNLIGYKQPDRLAVTTNETNFLTNRFPHLLRIACLAQAYSFMNNDERANTELQKLTAIIQKTNAESDLSYRGLTADFEVV